MKQKIMFTSSAGGHYQELMQLSPLFENYESVFLVEKNKVTKATDKKTHYLIYGSRKERTYLLKLFVNAFLSLFWFLYHMPHFVVSTGVHSTFPIMLLGKLFGRKLIYIETVANVYTPSLSGKIAYRFADYFVVQWEELLEIYPDAIYGGTLF